MSPSIGNCKESNPKPAKLVHTVKFSLNHLVFCIFSGYLFSIDTWQVWFWLIFYTIVILSSISPKVNWDAVQVGFGFSFFRALWSETSKHVIGLHSVQEILSYLTHAAGNVFFLIKKLDILAFSTCF
jgi:hypothetical protein